MARHTNPEHRAVLLCRVLDALSDADALPCQPRIRAPDARVKVSSFLIRSTQKVIDHYRRVLSILTRTRFSFDLKSRNGHCAS